MIKEAFQAIEDVVAKTYGEKIGTKKVKGAVEEEEVITPSVTMRPKIIEKESRLENVREEIKAYEEAIGEITESISPKKSKRPKKRMYENESDAEIQKQIDLLEAGSKMGGNRGKIDTGVRNNYIKEQEFRKTGEVYWGDAKKKTKFTKKDRADILNYEKDLNIAKKEEAQLLSELEKMYEVPSDMTLDKKGEIVPEDLNDTDVGLKIDVDVGKKSEQFVRNHIQNLVDTPEGLTKRMHTFEMAAKTEEILTKYVRRGEEPNTKDFINEIEKEFEVSLSEEAVGNLRQWMNIKNNAVPNRYINLLIQEGKGVESVEVMSEARRRTPAGNRKFQREPEKLLERMFVNAGGALHKDMGALAILDTVSVRTQNEGIKDITLSDLRRKDSDVYKKTMARVHKNMANEGFYLFGGRGDADRFYFVKMHPLTGGHKIDVMVKNTPELMREFQDWVSNPSYSPKAKKDIVRTEIKDYDESKAMIEFVAWQNKDNPDYKTRPLRIKDGEIQPLYTKKSTGSIMSLGAKTMAKAKSKPNPQTTEEKLQSQYVKEREKFVKSVAPNLNKKKMKHQFTRDEAKEWFDKVWESNILYDLSLNGFPISMTSRGIMMGQGKMSKMVTPQIRKEIDQYVKTLFGPGFIKGVVGYNKRLQIIMTPSWAGSKKTAGEMVDDLYQNKDMDYYGSLSEDFIAKNGKKLTHDDNYYGLVNAFVNRNILSPTV